MNGQSAFSLYRSESKRDYFVDKSMLLSELFPLVNQGNSHICLTRPRRFGKTVMANMIGAFFGKGSDAGCVFDTLNIAKEAGYSENLNQHNVIYIDFSVVDDECGSYQEYIRNIKGLLREDLQAAYPDIAFRRGGSVQEDLIRIFNQTGDKFLFVLDEWDAIFHMFFVTESDKNPISGVYNGNRLTAVR